MTGTSVAALCIAIVSNAAANLLLRRAMRETAGGSLRDTIGGLLVSGTFWGGMFCAVLLLGAYLYAIRSFPLGPAYAAVTASTIAFLTLWGVLSGSDTVSLLRMAGVVAVTAGVLMIILPSGG